MALEVRFVCNLSEWALPFALVRVRRRCVAFAFLCFQWYVWDGTVLEVGS